MATLEFHDFINQVLNILLSFSSLENIWIATS
jgi:hypothetical protein